ncbi:hypothetical protein DOTSEDRAFT_29553 [Dothistroma septosporum NZE10]|uniref:Uncharacterized protein n=1 Tax=Dothistroma septosporum (strain NZE10 / CBS 128990) TaxID=675120 RepID=N1PED8_DOTSN|nr:hypothetical protein DOTSEDRAFT_29553 [Dothistroma septosporum NZE10]
MPSDTEHPRESLGDEVEDVIHGADNHSEEGHGKDVPISEEIEDAIEGGQKKD